METKDTIFEGDILISNGDFVVQDSDQYHINDIIEANRGQYYQYPDIGYGAGKLLNAIYNKAKLNQEVEDALRKDFYDLNEVIVEGEGSELNIQIDAERTKW